jgi:hypothetical protein
MKKERQIGIRVGLPVFFALELEDVYRHTEGAHRALAFPDFVGLLVGMGLEQYRKGSSAAILEPGQEDIKEESRDIFTFRDEAGEPRTNKFRTSAWYVRGYSHEQ